MKPRSIIFALLLILPVVALAESGKDVARPTLVADVSAIVPGKTFNIGVLFKIDPGWHLYWKNPGDSGLPVKVALDLPPGLLVGDVQYPVPRREDSPGDITNYIYENEVLLIVPMTASKDISIGSSITITANLRWLVCKDVCLPGSATVSLDLPVSGESTAAHADLFQSWQGRLPVKADPDRIGAIHQRISVAQSNGRLTGTGNITIAWKTLPTDIDWYPAPTAGADITAAKITTMGTSTTISFKIEEPLTAANAPIDSVLAYTVSGGWRIGLDVPVTGEH